MMDKLEIPPESNLSGYNDSDTYVACKYSQGGRDVFNIDLSLEQLANLVIKPNPDEPTEGNRKIVLRHAQGFSKYLRNRQDSVIPPILLRAPEGVFEFEKRSLVSGTAWGFIGVPKLARNDISIIDGQHRILGIHLLLQEIGENLSNARSTKAAAKKQENAAAVKQTGDEIDKLLQLRKRISKEQVSVQIVIVDDAQEYKQIFVDIAENAKGITQAVKSRFDSTKVVNRCLEDIMEHGLLVGKVDLHGDRVLGDNPNLLGAKHVADIIRSLQVGTGGRISTHLESTLTEEKLIADTTQFLDLLCLCFKDLADIRDGHLEPKELRKRSLLGSVTMLRVLAGAHREFLYKNAHKLQHEEITEKRKHFTDLYRSLSNHMDAPIITASHWLESKAFQEGSMAPTARMGDMRELTTRILAWANSTPSWLK